MAVCCIGASAQSHNCSVSARVQMHPRLRPAMCIVLCIIVCQISHVKHQLLIQRLVLFFYPVVKQKPLQQGLLPIIFSNCFFSKNAATQHKPTREAKYSLCRFFLPHCQLLSIDGNFTNFYQRCSLWESLTYIYGCRRPYIYWIFRGFYGIVKP